MASVSLRPKELDRVFHEQLAFIGTQAVPVAVRLLYETTMAGLACVLRDQSPNRQHIDAAKAILDRAGFRLREQGSGVKELSEMSRDELAAFVLAGEAELAKRARQVNATETQSLEPDLSDLIE